MKKLILLMILTGLSLAATVAAEQPTPLNQISDFTMREGGQPKQISISTYFSTEKNITFSASSQKPDVGKAEIINNTLLKLTPVKEGSSLITLKAEKNGSKTEISFRLTVTSQSNSSTNRRPKFIKPIQEKTAKTGGDPLILNLADHFSDPDGDAMKFSTIINPKRTGTAEIVNRTLLKLTPLETGKAAVTVSVNDGNLATGRIFYFTVLPGNSDERSGRQLQTKTWENISQNQTHEFKIGKSLIPLNHIRFNISEPAADMAVNAIRHIEPPDRINRHEGEVYAYLETSGPSEIISWLELEFKILKQWLGENGREERLVFAFYNEGSWENLEFNMSGSDKLYNFYRANPEKTGFFAVAAQNPPGPGSQTERQIPEPADQRSTDQGSADQEAADEDDGKTEKTTLSKWNWILIGLTFFFVLLTALILYMKKQQRDVVWGKF